MLLSVSNLLTRTGRVREVGFGSHYIKNSTGQIHHPKAMLKSRVGGARVDQVGESKLVNVPKPLIRR